MDHNCLSCKYESTPPNSGICLECSEIPATCALWVPQLTTNADRIRSMTDEELAEWASIREMCFIYHLLINDPDLRNKCRIYENCKDCWLDWLKEEAK